MATIVTRSTGVTAKGTPLTTTELDNNFINLNDSKYESGSDISVGDITASGDIVVGVSASVSTNGTDQASATLLTSTFNVVTTATASQGVKLPTASAGLYITVKNDTSVNIKLYPSSGGSIEDESTDAAIDLAAKSVLTLLGVSSTKYNKVSPPEIAIYDSSGTRLN